MTKRARKTNHIERVNHTPRQRVARLVRSALGFSKSGENHVAALRYFPCHSISQAQRYLYNTTRPRAA
jgi:IS1 family transposase